MYKRQEADRLVEALYVASGFGMVIAARASISGAEGGCQAEIGSAAAMAAPALVHLQGGTPEQMANACAMAVKNLLDVYKRQTSLTGRSGRWPPAGV